MFEAEHLATLRVDSGHYVPDGAVFSGRVHRLDDKKDIAGVACRMKLLHRAQLCNVVFLAVLRTAPSTCTPDRSEWATSQD
jgi:hypothetical protein